MSTSNFAATPPFVTPQSAILRNSVVNKSTAFTKEERRKLGIMGLLPPCVETLEEQVKRAEMQLRAFRTPIEKHVYLASLLERNETLFYKLLLSNLEEIMPLIYTPTVGEACKEFCHIFRCATGMYISHEDREDIERTIDNWPYVPDIIVVTDGSRILGLGDLGANGMGIPIGKLSLYVAGAGFHPARTLPVQLDVGTNNEELLNDPLYLGSRHKRIRGPEFYSLVDRFINAVVRKWPDVLIQFEDFSNDVCFELLDKYKNKVLCFNDDIQGTGAVICSGFINAVRLSSIPGKEHRLVFYGAGSAGVGVADQIVSVLMQLEGLTREEARKRFWFVDSKGLVCTSRPDYPNMPSFKKDYARTDVDTPIRGLLDIVKYVKPTGIIGLSGQGQAFTEDVIREVSRNTPKPIIFALSNPTSNSECTAQQAYEWTNGAAIFASGSPFAPVTLADGRVCTPGQGNNMYIFPGLGLGTVISKSRHVSDNMVLAAAKELANCLTDEDLAQGRLYPRLTEIRAISTRIANAVAKTAVEEGLSRVADPPADWTERIRDYMYIPQYHPL